MRDLVDISRRYVAPVVKVDGTPADDFKFGLACGKKAADDKLRAMLKRHKEHIEALEIMIQTQRERIAAFKEEVKRLHRSRRAAVSG